MTFARSIFSVLAGILIVAGCNQPPAESDLPEVSIEEWTVPWERSRPRDPAVASSDEIWFVGQRSNYVARLTPSTGEFERFDLPDGAGPHNLIVADDGMVWYAGNTDAHIGKLDPATGGITRYDMPDGRARDPHTLNFDGQGSIWFTVQGGNVVGRIDMTSGEVALVDVPTSSARPYGIAIDSKGIVWVVEFSTNKLARIDPATMELTEIELPRTDARPRRLEVTSNDCIWYVDYAGGFLGRYDPVAGAFTEWAMPNGPASRPYGMTVDAGDNIWIVETGTDPNNFVGFSTSEEAFISETPIPSGGGAVRHMDYDALTNTVWFGTDTNTIGRAVLPW